MSEMKKGLKLTILGCILFVVGCILWIVGGYMMVEDRSGMMDFWMIVVLCGCAVTIVGMAIIFGKGVRVHIVKENEK